MKKLKPGDIFMDGNVEVDRNLYVNGDIVCDKLTKDIFTLILKVNLIFFVVGLIASAVFYFLMQP